MGEDQIRLARPNLKTPPRAPCWLGPEVSGCEDVPMSHEMFRFLPWPFRDGESPADLGVVIMRTAFGSVDGSTSALPALIPSCPSTVSLAVREFLRLRPI